MGWTGLFGVGLALAAGAGSEPRPNQSRDDYPTSAIAAGEHGSTIIAFDVSETGRAENCRAIRSSGSPALDAASCRSVGRNFTFPVSRDATGKARRISSGMTVHWMLAHASITSADLPIGRDDYSIWHDSIEHQRNGGAFALNSAVQQPFGRIKYPKAAYKEGRGGRTGMLVTIDRKGRVEYCSVVRSSGSADLDAAGCNFARTSVRYKPATDASGIAMYGTDYIGLNWDSWRRPD